MIGRQVSHTLRLPRQSLMKLPESRTRTSSRRLTTIFLATTLTPTSQKKRRLKLLKIPWEHQATSGAVGDMTKAAKNTMYAEKQGVLTAKSDYCLVKLK